MTLWVIGDSYATHRKESKKYRYLEDTWVERTGRLLNQNVVSHAKFSITVEYIFQKFNKISKDFKENDTVIVTLPYFVRRWHFRTKPLKIFFPTDDEQTALEHFSDHLIHFNEIHETFLINFLYHADYVSKKLNLHTIMMPTFFDVDELLKPIKDEFKFINFSDRSLSDVSIKEIKKECNNDKLNEWLQVHDPRVNHLLRSNHIALSNKIVDNIQNKTPIDLSNGFDTDIFDFNLAQDKNFITEQLFDNIMKRTHKIKLKNLT